MPLTQKMVAEGSVSWSAKTTLPSATLQSHASMVSGLSPKKHGVDWNDLIPAKGKIKVPTMFSIAKKLGLKTAMFAGKAKFSHLNIPGSLSKYEFAGFTDNKVAKAAAQYIRIEKPNLCLVHFPSPDTAGHEHGWGSTQQKQAFAEADKALKMVYDAVVAAGIEKSSVFILSADHGGKGKRHGSDDPEDMTILWIVWGAGIERGKVLSNPITTYDTAATALYLLGVPSPANWEGKPVLTAILVAQ